jgi:hypothetical protein
MTMSETQKQKLTGGCQCGAVRYAWAETPAFASVCHCRMCQKATGQPFAAFAGGPREHLTFTRGTPGVFKSSSFAERGFCTACGTPLTYAIVGSGEISVSMGSLDDPEAVRPDRQFGVEGKLSWTDGIAALPAQRTQDWMPADTTLVSHQHPDHETTR